MPADLAIEMTGFSPNPAKLNKESYINRSIFAGGHNDDKKILLYWFKDA